MAKHPHKLLLLNGKTWKCVLDGCAFFVHLGLAHVILGKRAICWKCGEIFIVDERALKSEKPICDDCDGVSVVPKEFNLDAYMNAQKLMREAGVKSTAELSPAKRMVLKATGALPSKDVTLLGQQDEDDDVHVTRKQMKEIEPDEEDEIENEYIHSPDCPSWKGGECNCM